MSDEMDRLIDAALLEHIPTESLISELLRRNEIMQFPRYVTVPDVFGHRETFPGNKILFEMVRK